MFLQIINLLVRKKSIPLYWFFVAVCFFSTCKSGPCSLLVLTAESHSWVVSDLEMRVNSLLSVSRNDYLSITKPLPRLNNPCNKHEGDVMFQFLDPLNINSVYCLGLSWCPQLLRRFLWKKTASSNVDQIRMIRVSPFDSKKRGSLNTDSVELWTCQ